MKIAITADLHLVTQNQHPERFFALENILDTLVDQKIEHLIIAGDLFDATCTQPGDFEKIANKQKYSRIHFYIISGNHDPLISSGTFVLNNGDYLTDPTIIELEKGFPFVFIPYIKGKSMGEILPSLQELKLYDKWVLVGHGDWISGRTEINVYEQGLYMPLSNRDIQIYKPSKVFLGHIHSGKDTPVLHYPGSPCAIDSSEEGIRSFLVFDSDKWTVERKMIETQIINYSVRLIVLPLDDEKTFIEREIEKSVKSWNILDTDLEKIELKVKVFGYSKNRAELVKVIKMGFKQKGIIKPFEPDISEVKVVESQTQEKIMVTAKEKLGSLDLNYEEYGISVEDVLLEMTKIIYGG